HPSLKRETRNLKLSVYRFNANSLEFNSTHSTSPYAALGSWCLATNSVIFFVSSAEGRRDNVVRYSFSIDLSGGVPLVTSVAFVATFVNRALAMSGLFISRSACGMPASYSVGFGLSEPWKKAANWSRGPCGPPFGPAFRIGLSLPPRGPITADRLSNSCSPERTLIDWWL